MIFITPILNAAEIWLPFQRTQRDEHMKCVEYEAERYVGSFGDSDDEVA